MHRKFDISSKLHVMYRWIRTLSTILTQKVRHSVAVFYQSRDFKCLGCQDHTLYTQYL